MIFKAVPRSPIQNKLLPLLFFYFPLTLQVLEAIKKQLHLMKLLGILKLQKGIYQSLSPEREFTCELTHF